MLDISSSYTKSVFDVFGVGNETICWGIYFDINSKETHIVKNTLSSDGSFIYIYIYRSA